MSELITHSRLASFRTCARKHDYRYVQQLVPANNLSRKRDWGSTFHAALEQHRLGRPAAAYEAIAAATLTDYDRVAVSVMFVMYVEFWTYADAEQTTLAVEAQFQAPLANPDSTGISRTFLLAGKMDAIFSDANGTWVMEHKTTSADITPGSEYWQRLRLDGQISIYMDGAAALGHAPAGVCYDVIKRPDLKPLKATPIDLRKYTQGSGCKGCGGKKAVKGTGTVGTSMCFSCAGVGWAIADGVYDVPRLYANQRAEDETPAEYGVRIIEAVTADASVYFQRGKVVRIGDEMADARRDTWQTAQALRHATRTGANYRNPDACSKFGSLCEYFALCTGTAGPGEYVHTAAHSELNALA